MTAHAFGTLIGTLFGSAVGLLLVGGFIIVVFFYPYMALSAVRNLRGIRQQLERMNDTLDSRGSDTASAPPLMRGFMGR